MGADGGMRFSVREKTFFLVNWEKTFGLLNNGCSVVCLES